MFGEKRKPGSKVAAEKVDPSILAGCEATSRVIDIEDGLAKASMLGFAKGSEEAEMYGRYSFIDGTKTYQKNKGEVIRLSNSDGDMIAYQIGVPKGWEFLESDHKAALRHAYRESFIAGLLAKCLDYNQEVKTLMDAEIKAVNDQLKQERETVNRLDKDLGLAYQTPVNCAAAAPEPDNWMPATERVTWMVRLLAMEGQGLLNIGEQEAVRKQLLEVLGVQPSNCPGSCREK
jgi:hypothetical protein